MNRNHKLSIIAVFDDNHDVIEPTLTALLECEQVEHELNIIYDGTQDIGRETIQSLLEYYPKDDVFFYDHEQPQGIGSSINEGLFNSSGSVIWLVRDLESVDEEKLKSLSEKLARSGAACCGVLPDNDADILTLLDDSTSAKEQSFLWNRDAFKDFDFFFSQFLGHFHNTELFLRLLPDYYLPVAESFVTTTGMYKADKNKKVYQEVLFSMLRSNLFEDAQKRHFMDLLREILFQTPDGEKEESSADISDNNPETAGSPVNYDPVLEALEEEESYPEPEYLLTEAQRERQLGNFSRALAIVREGLEHYEDHDQLKKFQIELLERLGRYVEASELKHAKPHHPPVTEEQKEEPAEKSENVSDGDSETIPEAEKPDVPSDENLSAEEQSAITENEPVKPGETPELSDDKIEVSIIIPTMAHGRHLLETVLASIQENIDPENTELIVVDNVSLDDTFELLEDLENINFFNLTVLRQQQNQGFGRSINIGLDIARGDYALVLHNDVLVHSDLPTLFKQRFEQDESIGIIGPLTNRTLNPDQFLPQDSEPQEAIEETEYVDSFCFMIPVKDDLRMDEQFGLAYFDDMDLCRAIRERGKKVVVDRSVFVEHFLGETTRQLNIEPGSQRYYDNEWLFHTKWGNMPEMPQEILEKDEITKLFNLEQFLINGHVTDQQKQMFKDWFTDEIKTFILNETWEPDYFFLLLRLLMKNDRRDVLRMLEDRIERYELPPGLVDELVEYYFNKNIFSRCLYYIDKFTNPANDKYLIYRLHIAWAERDQDRVHQLMEQLLEKNPGNPDLMNIISAYHKENGDPESSKEFKEVAAQLDPIKFGRRDSREYFGENS